MNGIIIVDKPAGLTSHDVVARLRRIYNTRRVGHSGTLDPLATGVLPVFIGRATRACEFAAADKKSYRARLLLGIDTDTQDITGSIIKESAVDVSLEQVKHACDSFLGDILQIPPMYSAIKIGGRKLYELAREGITVERKPRQITVYSIQTEQVDNLRYDLTVSCSKGTYIRTLCADIGALLGCGGTMESLRRIRSGCFDIAQSKTIEEISENPYDGLLPIDSLFLDLPRVTLDSDAEKKCRNGAPVPYAAEAKALYRAYSSNGEFLMLAEGAQKDGNTYLLTVKSFFEV